MGKKADEEKRAAFIATTLDDTLEGLTDLLPPDAMAAVRGRLHDDLVAHPVMSRLAREHAPREVPTSSDEIPIGEEMIEKARQLAKAKKNG